MNTSFKPWQPLPALLGYQWMLQAGMAMTTLTLALLKAQHLALGAASPLAPQGARLTIRDIHDHVAAAGYREISEIEWEDGYYEVEALAPDGQPVELKVNSDSGAIEDCQPRD